MHTIISICKNCNTNFTKARDSNKVHCSFECRAEFTKSNRKVYPNNYCKHCNAITAHNLTFCSRSCAGSYNNAQKDWSKIKTGPPKGYRNSSYVYKSNISFHNCEICGVLFTYNKVQKGSKRCCKSSECNKKFQYKVRTGKTGGYHPNSTRKHSSIYNGYKLDSGSELQFAKLLDANKIKWVKNSTIFFTFTYSNGKIGKYYPDFYLPRYNKWIEIKGKYYIREDDNLRWASVPNLEVIWSNNITLPKFVAGKTGNDPA